MWLADTVRKQAKYKHTGTWHYVNVARSATAVSAEACPSDGCVLSAIRVMFQRLHDSLRALRSEWKFDIYELFALVDWQNIQTGHSTSRVRSFFATLVGTNSDEGVCWHYNKVKHTSAIDQKQRYSINCWTLLPRLSNPADQGKYLPNYVEREFDDFLLWTTRARLTRGVMTASMKS